MPLGILDPEAAQFVVERYAGLKVYIPTLKSTQTFKLNIIGHPGDHHECARDLGCSERWVRKVRRELGLPTPQRKSHTIPSRIRNAILAMSGNEAEQVAKVVGCAITVVYRVRKDAGYYGSVRQDILTLLKTTDLAPLQIASRLGCSVSYVCAIRCRERRQQELAENDKPISGPQSGKRPTSAPTPAENLLNADLNARRRNAAYAECPTTTKAKGVSQ